MRHTPSANVAVMIHLSSHHCCPLVICIIPPTPSTYLANDAGANAAWILSCESRAGTSSPSGMPCPGADKCPSLHLTHNYYSYSQFGVDCKQQLAAAGVTGASGRRLNGWGPELGLGSAAHHVQKPSRHLAASSPEAGMSRAFQAAITKRQSGVSKPSAFISVQSSAQCLAAAKACGTLS